VVLVVLVVGVWKCSTRRGDTTGLANGGVVNDSNNNVSVAEEVLHGDVGVPIEHGESATCSGLDCCCALGWVCCGPIHVLHRATGRFFHCLVLKSPRDRVTWHAAQQKVWAVGGEGMATRAVSGRRRRKRNERKKGKRVRGSICRLKGVFGLHFQHPGFSCFLFCILAVGCTSLTYQHTHTHLPCGLTHIPACTMVLENYVGPLIMQYARKFIKDEDLLDLKLSVWGGDIQLRNLHLRADGTMRMHVLVTCGNCDADLYAVAL
jgi:hypothetical protein